MEYTDEYNFSRTYIVPGECILWKGKPGKGHLLTRQDIFMIPFSILWCGFAFVWEITAVASGAPFFFGIWGIPFILVGLYITVGRFFHTAYLRRHTAYVITNKKIIRRRGKRVDMLGAGNMPSTHITTFADGSGNIRFGEYNKLNRRFSFDDGFQDGTPFTLENVSDVVRVHQIIGTMER